MEVAEQDNISKTAKYFKTVFKYAYLIGWPNFWHSEHDVPAIFKRHHYSVSGFMIVSALFLVVNELTAFFTQHELSEKQKTDRQLLGFSHPVQGSFGYFLTHFQKSVRAFSYCLTVELKEQYNDDPNDEQIEAAMIKQARRHSIAFSLFCGFTLVSYGFDGMMQCLFNKDGTFVTIITAWPDLNDHSTRAVCYRVLSYIVWWMFMTRVASLYVIVISTFICLGHQYKNLQSYFYSLNNIFDDISLTQNEKEEKYEKALKLGINMHARTLWCTRECGSSFNGVVSGQIVVNVAVIMFLMAQMLDSERTFSSVAVILTTMAAMLLSTGYFMWNAGDITVEAEALSTAMFSSGWQHCVGRSSTRVRKLLVIAMMQAQVPVSIRALGIITMSYESYVSIVKSSYSVFSVLY